MRAPISSILCCLLALACSSSSQKVQAPPPLSPEPEGARVETAPTSAAGGGPAPAQKGCACQLKLKAPAASSAGASPSPISGDLPAAPFDLERRSTCTAPVCRLGDFLPDPTFVNTTREGVPAQGAVWLETLADKSTLVLPSSPALESLALVLEGKVSYGPGERAVGKTAESTLAAWQALRAPAAGYHLTAQGGKASVLVAVLSRSGTLAEAIEQSKKKGVAKPESAALETADLSSLPHLKWAREAHHARVAFGAESGAPKGASLSLLQASGRGVIPENVHIDEWEHIVILRGGGEMLLGNAKYAVSPGSVFHVPRGTPHGWTGSGDDLSAIIIFSPGGPEQRFVGAAQQEASRPSAAPK